MAYNPNNAGYDQMFNPQTMMQGSYVMVRWGEKQVCEACLAPHHAMYNHKKQNCPDYKAFNRINNGYSMTVLMNRVPNGMTRRDYVSGEMYRMVRNVFMVTPTVIMGQRKDWRPYLPMVPDDGMALQPWHNRTYESLVAEIEKDLPTFIPPHIGPPS